LTQTPFGRIDEPASISLSNSLRTTGGFKLGRLKTGTPPRLAKDSIKFEGMLEMKGDRPAAPFGFMTEKVDHEVRPSLFRRMKLRVMILI
jgi:tRNA uridine 5-carboxymethylaminomethyl modification enzyme